MNQKATRKPIAIIFIGFWLLFTVRSYAQQPDKYWKQVKSVYETLEKVHIRPIVPDDKWSQIVFDNYIDILDPQGLLLTAEDLASLSKYKTELDNYIVYGENDFFTVVSNLYQNRIKEADSIITVLTQKPFDYTEKDTLFQYSGNIIYAKNKRELAYRWKKTLKYRMLTYMFTVHNGHTNIADVVKNEPEARKTITLRQKQRIKRLLNPPAGFENQMAENLFNAIALSFDPHSSYFSVNEKNNFESNLSGEKYSYGFDIDETENGEIEIVRLIPGGPAWRSNELHKGDILLKAQWGKNEVYDLTVVDDDEMESLFESIESPKLELTVRKINGQVKTISLIKEKITTNENTIKSLLLRGDHDFGYIYLPGFYTEWDDESPAGCATDMAREILKLRKENIDGIIIDLRFNGGGSMGEALSLSGIFINEGPLSIVQNSGSKPTVLKDFNRGSIYDDPLIILVNGYSASASEIVTGTLQDYNRAIIVGSNTYGKASSQVIIPATENQSNASKIGGYVKVTNGKIYRITGKSHQRTGVIPDIKLPGYFEFGPKEGDTPNALPSDSVSKKAFFTPLPNIPLQLLSDKSNHRIASNESFKKIASFNTSIDSMLNEKNTVLLNLKEFKNKEWDYYQKAQKLDSLIHTKTSAFKVLNNKYDKQVIDLDSYKSELNQILINNVEKDIYIEECYRILNDLITFKQINQP